MAQTRPQWQSWLENVLTEMGRMRDELQLQLHLAGMDAKDAWDALAEQLQAIEQNLERARQASTTTAGEARLQAHLALMEARDRWSELQPRLQAVARAATGSESRVESNLAEALRDLSHRIEAERPQRREALQTQLDQAAEGADEAAQQGLEQLRSGVEQVRDLASRRRSK